MKTFLYYCSLIASLCLQGMPDHCHALPSEALVPAGPAVQTGVGPYSVKYSNSGKFAAVVNDSDDTVSVYRVHSRTGAFEPIQTIASGNAPNFVVYSPEDKFAYLTNFGSFGPGGSIIVYSIDPKTGIWSNIQTINDGSVSSPYGFDISPCGKFLAVANFGTGNPGSGSIAIYQISGHTGMLKFIAITPHQSPEILAFSPDGQYLAVTNFEGASVSVFKMNSIGYIQEIEDSPFPVGLNPEGVAYKHNGKAVAIANTSDGTVTFYRVNSETGQFYDMQTYATGDSAPAELAFSNDDTLLAVGSFNNPGTATVFCVKGRDKTLIQSIPNLQGPYTFAFNPSNKNFAALSIFGNGTDPGSVQVYKVNNSACSHSSSD